MLESKTMKSHCKVSFPHNLHIVQMSLSLIFSDSSVFQHEPVVTDNNDGVSINLASKRIIYIEIHRNYVKKCSMKVETCEYNLSLLFSRWRRNFMGCCITTTSNFITTTSNIRCINSTMCTKSSICREHCRKCC